MNPKYFSLDIVYLLLLQITIITVFIPLAFFYLLTQTGKIDSVMINNVSERKIPLILHILLVSALIKKNDLNINIPELYYFFLGTIVSSVIALILVFFKIKASLHMLAIGGLTMFCIAISICFQTQNIQFIATLLVCNGIIGTSRLLMKAHTIDELILGYIIGFLPQLILASFLL
jgi:membrane-associated phospholipid phosphatase